MNKPTDEQIKEFWEWCGFKKEEFYWRKPNGELWVGMSGIPIDLNNLFKYAVPKVKEKLQLLYVYFDAPYDEREEWYCKVSSDATGKMRNWSGNDEDPALALFWSLYEVRGE